MPDKEQIKLLRKKMTTPFNKLKNVASGLTSEGNQKAMIILESISLMENIFDDAEREAKNG